MVLFGGASFGGELFDDVHLLETDFLGRTANTTGGVDEPTHDWTDWAHMRVDAKARVLHAKSSTFGATKVSRPGSETRLSRVRAKLTEEYELWQRNWRDLRRDLDEQEQIQQQKFDDLFSLLKRDSDLLRQPAAASSSSSQTKNVPGRR